MQRIQFATVFMVASILAACGSKEIEPETRVYGIWVDPSSDGEVIFRDDGSMTWFGDDGTYVFEQSNDFFMCNGGGGCEGQLVITLPNQNFRLGYRASGFDYDQDVFYFTPRNDYSTHKDMVVNGKSVGNLTMHRKGTFVQPIMPATFTSFGNAESLNAGRYEQTNQGSLEFSSGSIFLTKDSSLYRLDDATDTWTFLRTDEGYPSFGFSDAAIFNGSANVASLDGGNAWQSTPDLGEVFAYHVVDTTIFANKRTYDDSTSRSELWKLDLTTDAPAWQLLQTYTNDEMFQLNQPSSAALLVMNRWNSSASGQTNSSFISTDMGATWTAFSTDCPMYVPVAHEDGVYCELEGGDVNWFDQASNSWTQYSPGGDEILRNLPTTDGLYLVRGEDLIKWQPDGTETTIITVSSSLGYGSIELFGDDVFVSKYGLWRAER